LADAFGSAADGTAFGRGWAERGAIAGAADPASCARETRKVPSAAAPTRTSNPSRALSLKAKLL
jgi:hypothetical protein